MNEWFWGSLTGAEALLGQASRPGPIGTATAVVLALLIMLLGGCATQGGRGSAGASADGSDGSSIADAVPRVEPLSKTGNAESYKVRGKRYFTKKSAAGHIERGLASWYGGQFHGRKTSSGERYDMYAMTAAHKTLPLPSYVRVTNMENGRTAVVRVNDRGPFHGPRVLDLSYSAAKKLGVIPQGTAMVEVRAIDPARPGADPGPFLASRGTPAAKAARRPVQTAAKAQASGPTPSSPKKAPVGTDALPVIAAAPTPAPDLGRPAVGPTVAAVAARPQAATPPKAVDEAASQPVAASASNQGLYLQVGAFGDPKNAERLRERLVASLSEQVGIQHSASSGAGLYKVRIGPLGSEGQAKAISAKLITLGVEQPRRVWN